MGGIVSLNIKDDKNLSSLIKEEVENEQINFRGGDTKALASGKGMQTEMKGLITPNNRPGFLSPIDQYSQISINTNNESSNRQISSPHQESKFLIIRQEDGNDSDIDNSPSSNKPSPSGSRVFMLKSLYNTNSDTLQQENTISETEKGFSLSHREAVMHARERRKSHDMIDPEDLLAFPVSPAKGQHSLSKP